MSNYQASFEILSVLNKLKDHLHSALKNQYAALNLSGPQSMIVHLLVHEGRQNMSFFSEKMGLTNATISGIVDRLEKQGLVKRVRDEKDRRVVYLEMTEQLSAQVCDHRDIVENVFGEILQYASEEERQALFDGFQVLEKLMERKEDV